MKTQETLYHRYRPQSTKGLIGQESVVAALKSTFNDLQFAPHCCLFVGPSGCGKTTTVRILQKKLQCHSQCYYEINGAEERGIDDIRKIKQGLTRAPMGGKCIIYCIDECHKLTNDAQNALLKPLEDTPAHVYFFLCTTDPQKLLTTIKTRATQYTFKRVNYEGLKTLVTDVAEKENFEFDEDVLEDLIERADGSPRKALVLLDAIYRLDDVKEQMNALHGSDDKAEGIDIARILTKSGVTWADIKGPLQKLEMEPETVRRIILGYCQAILLKAGKQQVFHVMSYFLNPFFNSGKPGLVHACFECIEDMKK